MDGKCLIFPHCDMTNQHMTNPPQNYRGQHTFGLLRPFQTVASFLFHSHAMETERYILCLHVNVPC